MNLLKIENLIKTFDTELFEKKIEVLKGVSFSIPAGKTVGFLGANGAGKTTLLKILMGFIPKNSGEVSFSKSFGQNDNEIFAHLGFLPERPYFYPHLKGRELAFYMGKIQDLDRLEIEEGIEKWSKVFKIDHALDRDVRGYSKGMLQRLGFMCTLLHDPRLIILDEPLSGLDPIGRKELKDVMKVLQKEGKSIFFSSHIVSDIEEVCDRVIFLKNGLIEFEGDVKTLVEEKKQSLEDIFYWENHGSN